MSDLTIQEAYRQASSLLLQEGIEDANRHAELLIQEVLGWNRTEFLLRWDEPFPSELATKFDRYLQRRISGEPLQYIVGEQEFYGLPFRVNPSVLIPRPETELLVEAVLQRGDELLARSGKETLRVLDIGTGSGAIAVTLAVKRPTWQITASDISEDALRVAKQNAELNGVADRMNWVRGDLLTPWLAGNSAIASDGNGNSDGGVGADQRLFDIIVSNPPYIEEEEIDRLQIEVRQYEPHTALSGGKDGLRIYARLADQLEQLGQRRPSIVALEVGQGQDEAVSEMLAKLQEWDDISVVPDLAGIMRHVVAVRTKI